jgi:hypothetical protein
MRVPVDAKATVLADRIRTLRTGLQRLETVVADHGERPDEVGTMARALGGWFGKAVNERMDLLNKLHERAERTTTAADELECWTDLLDQEAYLKPVAEQALEVLGGALLRSIGADGGMCRVADRLLGELASQLDLKWELLTLLATGERLDIGSWVVRLRFPSGDVWSLPNAVHELAHYAIEQYEDSSGRNRLRTFVKDGLPGLSEAKAKEVMADALATLLLGPALTASLIWRASPAAGAGEGDSHPGWDTRVRTSLCCLDLLVLDGRLTRDMNGVLERQWCQLRARVGVEPDAVDDLPFWRALADELGVVLPTDNRFPGLDAANAVATRLRGGKPAGSTDLIALLTAPWLVRLTGSAAEADLTAQAASDAMIAAVRDPP